ncbi:hypothetical protein P168DRAFT_278829 [Aspergillus campestris IBT 28561]|uniref:Uncharacterized protein n=1 Tax=Aspergillus campestris (strain IBT 28561) TaxID=1392248 RepID=A0A2I1DHI8_ASPC2|nr:uncharacterized protein P168DRAFT_278829 [Aspergillus campestris IBT 28561]PKY09336.1 hypothetical protein P168DRAFT_278829 [Aspergillus campestris IBT 28561]
MDPPKTASPVGNSYRPERLQLILVKGADTLVYIDSPPLTSSWSALPRTTESIPHRINSETLWETGSAYFAGLLHPRNQARTVKRRGLAGKLDSDIKYVLDLTPPSLDEDAIIFLTELSCPLGIRLWSRYQNRFSLPSFRVGGQDELEQGSESAHCPASKLALPVEYSASRHRMAIYWLLRSFYSWTPPLDTPCKLWTYFALAKLFNVVMVPRVRESIFNWINESNNTLLIERSPESTYRVACAMQDIDLLRDSFSVLVGEEALLLLANSDKTTKGKPSQCSFHGRFREELDDEELQRIEYASKSFMEHVINIFLYLAGTEMTWITNLPSVRNILNYNPKSENERVIVSNLIADLKTFVRKHIVNVLQNGGLTWFPQAGLVKATQGSGQLVNPTRGQGSPIDQEYPSEKALHAYGEMRPFERLASRTFWKDLLTRRTLVYNPPPPIIDDSDNITSIADIAPHLPAFQTQHDAVLTPIPWNQIGQATETFNALTRTTTTTTTTNPPPNTEDSPSPEPDTFSLWEFVAQARGTIQTYSTQLAEPPQTSIQCRITDTLTTLTDNEYKFLPLWAGGNDDGTGGVYADQDIPFLETGGFSTPGPAIHMGSSAVRLYGVKIDIHL